MTLKKPTKHLSAYARHKKRPYVYSEAFQQWSRAAMAGILGGEAARRHDDYILRVNGWSKLPGRDHDFMRFNQERVEYDLFASA